jgi:hypothetical protein
LRLVATSIVNSEAVGGTVFRATGVRTSTGVAQAANRKGIRRANSPGNKRVGIK